MTIYFSAFNNPHLEKNPQLEVPRPPRGALGRTLNNLTAAEERRVEVVLQALSEDVQKRRVMTFPYFKDYDRVGNVWRQCRLAITLFRGVRVQLFCCC